MMAGSSIQIMYVDDDSDDRFLFETAIRKTGYDVDLTLLSDGTNFFNTLKQNNYNYHIVFLDLNMPVISGIDLLNELNKSGDINKLNTVILSTSNNPEDVELTYKLNAVKFITKPMGFSNLVDTLKDTIEDKKNWALPIPIESYLYTPKQRA